MGKNLTEEKREKVEIYLNMALAVAVSASKGKYEMQSPSYDLQYRARGSILDGGSLRKMRAM